MKLFSIFSFLLGCLIGLSSCTDEILTDSPNGFESGMQAVSIQSRAYPSDNSDLQLMNDGTWKASRQVPLTGAGRTLGNISPGLITVLNGTNAMENILNDNLTDKAVLAGLATTEALFGHLISVKDLYRTYSGGQKAGFVYGVNNTSLLSAEVLKLFTITLYNDGKLLKTFNLSESSGVLGLDLINIETCEGTPQMSLAVTVPDGMKFDEIAFGVAGVAADVLSSIEFYYAFVGETPIRTTVKGSPNAYNNASIYRSNDPGWSNWALQKQLVDNIEGNGPAIELVGGLLNVIGGGYRTTVNFGEQIPGGSEVGFVYTTGNVLNLGLGNTMHLSTYGPDPDKGLLGGSEPAIEKYTAGSVLGASLIGGGKGALSFVTKKNFQNLYLHIVGVNVDLGVMQFHYAYTRSQTRADATSEFNFPESITTTNSYTRIYAKNPKGLTVQITSPNGATAQYDPQKQMITGMTVPGNYEVTFTYKSANGMQFTQKSVITKEVPTPGDQGCNQLITAAKHKATLATGLESGALLCAICTNAKHPEHLLDESVSTCMEHFGALELIGNTNIISVRNIQNLTVDPRGYRAGFILQVNKELLSLNALNFLYVDVYKNGQKLERQVSGSVPTVDLGLLNGAQGKLRVGVTLPANTPAFDEIRLYTAGIAKLNLNTLRLYGVYYEPSHLTCSSNGVPEACMEIMTPYNSGVTINYQATDFNNLLGVANGMYSLDYILDDDKNSHVTMLQTEALSVNTGIAISFPEKDAYETIGLIIQNVGAVASLDLANKLRFIAYNKGAKVDQLSYDSDLLNLHVISHGDYSYIEFQPKSPFDEIRISNAGLLPGLKDLNVYGIYTRTDSNKDGVPDCGEEGTTQSEQVFPSIKTLHVCQGEKISIPVSGGKVNSTYRLDLKQYTNELLTKALTPFDKNVTYNGNGYLELGNQINPGVYLVDFYESGAAQPYYTNMSLFVHPRQTTWKGNKDLSLTHDWNHWENWVEGAPWGCTDVVIPAGCANYPILKKNEDNFCARILFTSNVNGEIGEVVHTYYLTYDQAWVDKTFQSAKDELLSAPLKETYTGDVFAQAADKPFTFPLGINGYTNCWPIFQGEIADANFRFSPQVYQQTFGGRISNVTPQGSETLKPDENNWTTAFNLVAEPYELGQAYRVRFGENTGSTYFVRWPKLHPSYEYYLLSDGHPVLPGRKEMVTRTPEQTGRFIYEATDGTSTFPLRLTRRNERPGDLYLFGNPFMSHVNIERFFEANVAVGEVWLLRWDTPKAMPTYVRIHRSDAQAANSQIRPMEGFLIKLRSPYAEQNRYQYYIHLLPEMMEQKK